MPDDYSPVVEEGELEPGSGLRARLRRRQELAPVGPGYKRVLLRSDGSPISSDSDFTAGEKRFTEARRWARVDVRHHRLEYGLTFSDPDGHAGFVATIAVDATVTNATSLFEYGGSSSVKDVLEPALYREVVDGSESEASSDSDADDIRALAHLRQRTQSKLRDLEGKAPDDVPDWLSAKIQTTKVDFDDTTQRHYDELIKLDQQGHLIDANQKNEEKEIQGKVKVRGLWRDDLLPQLTNPSQRIFEQVYANPTDENIAAAVGQANDRELLILQEVLRSFETLVKEGYVDKGDPTVRALNGMVGRLPHLLSPSEPALPRAEQGDVLDAAPPEEQQGDRDFSD